MRRPHPLGGCPQWLGRHTPSHPLVSMSSLTSPIHPLAH